MLAWHILCYGIVSVYGSVRYKPVFCQNNTKHISTPKQCRTQWRGQRFWSGGIDRDRVWEGFFPPKWGWICGEAMPLPRNYFEYFDFWIKMVHYGLFCALFFYRATQMQRIGIARCMRGSDVCLSVTRSHSQGGVFYQCNWTYHHAINRKLT